MNKTKHRTCVAVAALVVTLTTPVAAGTLTGTAEVDVLTGGVGSDTLKGNAGNDILFGDPATFAELNTYVGNYSPNHRNPPGGSPGIHSPSLSKNGRYMVVSSASNVFLPTGQTSNGTRQIYIEDYWNSDFPGLISQGENNAVADGDSSRPVISGDGRYVAYETSAVKIKGLPSFTTTDLKIIVHDRKTGQNYFLSHAFQNQPAEAAGGGFSQEPAFSPDGTLVAFVSEAALVPDDTNMTWDVYVASVDGTKVHRVTSKADGSASNGGLAQHVSFSPDGKSIVFASSNSTLTASDSNNFLPDVFIKNLDGFTADGKVTGDVHIISRDGLGTQDTTGGSDRPAFSPDGREVLFFSTADNLVPSDTNGDSSDIFIKTVKDGGPRLKGTIRLVSRDANGAQIAMLDPESTAAISPDGTAMAFVTSSNVYFGQGPVSKFQLLLKKLTDDGKGIVSLLSLHQTTRLAGDGTSRNPAFVQYGRSVVFESSAKLDDYDKNDAYDVYFVNTGEHLDNVLGGADILDGGPGADLMIGGKGSDTYYVDNVGDQVIEVNHDGSNTVRSSVSYKLPDYVNTLILVGINNINGTANDSSVVIKGNPGNNRLTGGIGNDLLEGGGGKDVLNGGPGRDRLRGDKGADRFVFTDPSHTRPSQSKRDVILDFSKAQGDVIDVSKIDANTKVKGDQAFRWLGSGNFDGKPGALRIAKRVLLGDVNGDKKPDFGIKIDGTSPVLGASIKK